MPAKLAWYEADGETPLGRLIWGSIPPGSSYHEEHGAYLQMVLKNEGSEDADVTLHIRPYGSTKAHEYTRMAIGEGAPGTFYDEGDPIDAGTIPPDGTVRIWLNLIVPAMAPMDATASVTIAAVAFAHEEE